MSLVANIDQAFLLFAALSTLVLCIVKLNRWYKTKSDIELFTFGIIFLFCLGNIFALKVLGESVIITILSHLCMILGSAVVTYTYMMAFKLNTGAWVLRFFIPVSILCTILFAWNFLGWLQKIDFNYPTSLNELIALLFMPVTTFIVFSIYLANFVHVARLAEWNSVRLVSRLIGGILAICYMANRFFVISFAYKNMESLTVFSMSMQILIYAFFILTLIVSYGPEMQAVEGTYLYLRRYFILVRLQRLLEKIKGPDYEKFIVDKTNLNDGIISILTEILDIKRSISWDKSEIDEIFTLLDQVSDDREDYMGLAYQYSKLV